MDPSSQGTAIKVEELRSKILTWVGEYSALVHASEPFIPGVSPVLVSGRVFGPQEVEYLVDSALDFWLTSGRFNERFEKRLEEFLKVPFVSTTNSGSSANLLAVASLTSPSLGERALRPGDEVITTAVSFPTTVNPLLLYGLVPVFVDITIPTYNASVDEIESAISDRTRAIVLAHTLGNPFDLGRIMKLVEKYNLWLIEDCCDALGSTYKGQGVGSFGHLATLSFYPAHHITTGEGGAVATQNPRLNRIAESFRDWGRDCYCDPGKDNTCGKRFEWQLGDLPKGYDHKYIYSHAGFNLKITDMQAAVGLAQMERLEQFITLRKNNYSFLRSRLEKLEELFILPEPTPQSDPAWFGFPLTLREGAPFARRELVQYLDQHKIATRLLFAGNITRQPYFAQRNYRVVGGLENTDAVMERTFWVGVFPRLTEEMLNYTVSVMEKFVQEVAWKTR